MREVVLWHDLEAWAVGYLKAQLATRTEPFAADVYVATKVPTSLRDRMVILRRDGGPQLGIAHELARFGVRIFALDDVTATRLTNLVRSLLAASIGEGPIRGHNEIAGPSSVTEESGRPVRYFSVELTARATITVA